MCLIGKSTALSVAAAALLLQLDCYVQPYWCAPKGGVNAYMIVDAVCSWLHPCIGTCFGTVIL